MSVNIPGIGKVYKQKFQIQRGGYPYLYGSGRGIGGVFRGVARFLLPLIRNYGKNIMRKGMKATADILDEKSRNYDKPFGEITSDVLQKHRQIFQKGEGIRQKKNITENRLNELISGYVVKQDRRKKSKKTKKKKKQPKKKIFKKNSANKVKKKQIKKRANKKFDIFD